LTRIRENSKATGKMVSNPIQRRTSFQPQVFNLRNEAMFKNKNSKWKPKIDQKKPERIAISEFTNFGRGR